MVVESFGGGCTLDEMEMMWVVGSGIIRVLNVLYVTVWSFRSEEEEGEEDEMDVVVDSLFIV